MEQLPDQQLEDKPYDGPERRVRPSARFVRGGNRAEDSPASRLLRMEHVITAARRLNAAHEAGSQTVGRQANS